MTAMHSCVGTCGQHVRFSKVRNANGNVKKGKYIMTMDFSGVNYDFNDNVFLLENASRLTLNNGGLCRE